MRDSSAFAKLFGAAACFLAIGLPGAYYQFGALTTFQIVGFVITLLIAALITATLAYFAKTKWTFNRITSCIAIIMLLIVGTVLLVAKFLPNDLRPKIATAQKQTSLPKN